MAPTSSFDEFNEFTAIEEVGPGQFRSTGRPQSSGNAAMAYGGFALAVATRAAYATVPTATTTSSSSSSSSSPSPPPPPPPTYALYSLLGQYLGPTLTSAPLQCAVRALRTTRTFATRRVEVRQARPDGATRLVLAVLADFHARDEPALLTYSAPPARAYAGPAEQPEGGFAGVEPDDDDDDDDGEGSSSDAAAAAAAIRGGSMLTPAIEVGLTALTERFFETRPCREGVAYQNRNGALKHARTTQEGLAPTSRTAAEWHRAAAAAARGDDENATTTTTTPAPADQAAAAAFLLDGGLAYLPLTLHHRWFDEVAACSTLDVALRFLTPGLDLRAWHLRERTSPAAGAGRSYAEARLWGPDGTLVAVMTQQGILRPVAAPRGAAKM